MESAASSPELTNAAGRRRDAAAWVLFVLSSAGYLAIFLSRLEDFPIYFFCDEAIQTVAFQELRERDWRGQDEPHELLPAYFRNNLKSNLSLSVYLQGVVSLWLGQRIEVVRGVSVLAGFSGVVALALLLRRARLREWWLAVPVLACAPGWFLHSRTGFECGLMAACYAWFLFFYHRYRTGDLKSIFGAMLFGAGAFYAYANGQGLMLVSGLALLVLDWRWHRQHLRWAGLGLAFALLLFAPYVRFRLQHPTMMQQHLADLSTYLTNPALGPAEKLLTFLREYLSGFNPRFWFGPVAEPYLRHQPLDLGHFTWLLLPFALLGLGFAWKHRGDPAARLLAVAAAAAPFTAALAEFGITRGLAMIWPLAALVVAGWELLARQLRERRLAGALRWGGGSLLLLWALTLRTECLARGPEWSRTYGLFGMQWGAQAVFRDCLPGLATRFPTARIMVSHTWANFPEAFVPFFGWRRGRSTPAQRGIELNALEQMVGPQQAAPDPGDIVVFPAAEMPAVLAHEYVEAFTPLQRIRAPDGSVGFYVGHLRFQPDWRKHAAEKLRRLAEPVESRIEIGGEPATVRLSGLEKGDARTLLAGSAGDFVRLQAGLPLKLVVHLPRERRLRIVEVRHADWGRSELLARTLRGRVVVDAWVERTDVFRGDPKIRRREMLEEPIDTIEIEIKEPGLLPIELRGISLVFVDENAP